jgi:hypothetical protein
MLHVLTAAQSERAECLRVSTINIHCQPIISPVTVFNDFQGCSASWAWLFDYMATESGVTVESLREVIKDRLQAEHVVCSIITLEQFSGFASLYLLRFLCRTKGSCRQLWRMWSNV